MQYKTDQQIGQLAAALVKKYDAVCDANNLSRATASALLGVTPTRLAQLSKAVQNDEPVMIGLDAFIRIVSFCKSVPELEAAGVLPAASKRGAAQQLILDHVGLS